ncbi:MAG: hypothetical protein NT105_20400 [Verrucomicrobia bacterium]|nr:hypothetical protein [Verrucomicrobiota bacterium]
MISISLFQHYCLSNPMPPPSDESKTPSETFLLFAKVSMRTTQRSRKLGRLLPSFLFGKLQSWRAEQSHWRQRSFSGHGTPFDMAMLCKVPQSQDFLFLDSPLCG